MCFVLLWCCCFFAVNYFFLPVFDLYLYPFFSFFCVPQLVSIFCGVMFWSPDIIDNNLLAFLASLLLFFVFCSLGSWSPFIGWFFSLVHCSPIALASLSMQFVVFSFYLLYLLFLAHILILISSVLFPFNFPGSSWSSNLLHIYFISICLVFFLTPSVHLFQVNQ